MKIQQPTCRQQPVGYRIWSAACSVGAHVCRCPGGSSIQRLLKKRGATGLRYVNTGGLDVVGSNGYYWAAVPSGATTTGRYLRFDSSSVSPVNSSNRGNGLSVRCVSELLTG